MLVDRNNNGYKIIFELEKPVKCGYMELFLKREKGKKLFGNKMRVSI